MSRCKACDKPLQDYEELSKNSSSRKHEEMCRLCINLGYTYSYSPEQSFIDTPLLDILPYGPRSFDN